MQKKKCSYFFSFFIFSICAISYAQIPYPLKNSKPSENPIPSIIEHKSEILNNVLNDAKKYKIQIIYTQINRDKNNKPSFIQYNYLLDNKKYFYAASLVKLPICALSLEKLNELKIKGLDKNSIMFTDSSSICQKKTIVDTTAKNGLPSIEQYIKRMLLVSDNDAYSRAYEFLGQQYIHDKLVEKGYSNAFIIHRFDANCNTDNNKSTNAIDFYSSSKKLIYHQPAQKNIGEYKNPLGKVGVGIAYLDAKNKKIDTPKDFTFSNYLSLQDITEMLKSIIFPKSVLGKKDFNLTSDDRNFLLKYLCMLPRESDFPHYDTNTFYDSYKKYLLFGDSKKRMNTDSISVFNIVGQSYGFMSDVAYICDFKNNIEFMLSAVIYTNEDEILNDGVYEYNSVALPYFSELGKQFYNYERNRKRLIIPNLKEFKAVKN